MVGGAESRSLSNAVSDVVRKARQIQSDGLVEAARLRRGHGVESALEMLRTHVDKQITQEVDKLQDDGTQKEIIRLGLLNERNGKGLQKSNFALKKLQQWVIDTGAPGQNVQGGVRQGMENIIFILNSYEAMEQKAESGSPNTQEQVRQKTELDKLKAAWATAKVEMEEANKGWSEMEKECDGMSTDLREMHNENLGIVGDDYMVTYEANGVDTKRFADPGSGKVKAKFDELERQLNETHNKMEDTESNAVALSAEQGAAAAAVASHEAAAAAAAEANTILRDRVASATSDLARAQADAEAAKAAKAAGATELASARATHDEASTAAAAKLAELEQQHSATQEELTAATDKHTHAERMLGEAERKSLSLTEDLALKNTDLEAALGGAQAKDVATSAKEEALARARAEAEAATKALNDLKESSAKAASAKEAAATENAAAHTAALETQSSAYAAELSAKTAAHEADLQASLATQAAAHTAAAAGHAAALSDAQGAAAAAGHAAALSEAQRAAFPQGAASTQVPAALQAEVDSMGAELTLTRGELNTSRQQLNEVMHDNQILRSKLIEMYPTMTDTEAAFFKIGRMAAEVHLTKADAQLMTNV